MDKVLAIGDNVLSIGGMLLKPIERKDVGIRISIDSGYVEFCKWGWWEEGGYGYDYKVLGTYSSTTPFVNEFPSGTDYLRFHNVNNVSIEIKEPNVLTNWSGMFVDSPNIVSADLSKLNQTRLNSLYSTTDMFKGCSKLTTFVPTNTSVNYINDCSGMFSGCSSLEAIDFTNMTFSGYYFASVFEGCSSLKSIDVSNTTNTSVAYFTNLFKGCSSLTSFNLMNVGSQLFYSFDSMFDGCTSIENIDLTPFSNTNDSTTYRYAFRNCTNLKTLDLSGFWRSTYNQATVAFANMFSGCSNLQVVYIDDCPNYFTTPLKDALQNQTSRTYNIVQNYQGRKALVRQ